MSSHFPLPKNVAVFLPTLSNGASRATSDRKPKTKVMIRSCPVLDCSSHRKNESNEYQKLLEIEKEIVHEVARGDRPYLRNLQIAKHKSGRRSFSLADWFVLCDLSIFSGNVYHPEPPHAQSLFLFPIVFGIHSFQLAIRLLHYRLYRWFSSFFSSNAEQLIITDLINGLERSACMCWGNIGTCPGCHQNHCSHWEEESGSTPQVRRLSRLSSKPLLTLGRRVRKYTPSTAAYWPCPY